VICPSDLDLGTQNIPPNAGILLMSPDPALAALIKPMLEAESLRLLAAPTREEAHDLIMKDEQIAFIIGDLPDGISAEDAANWLQKNRQQITWARLPAAVLLPQSLIELENYLRDSGVMGESVPKPLDIQLLLDVIRSSQAR
jgi:DNA-binding response OmpR family regulator